MALFRENLGPDYGIPPDFKCQEAVPLYKLHGSLNWATRKDNGTVYPLRLDQYFSKYSINDFNRRSTCKVPVGSQLQEYFSMHSHVEVEQAPVIVPPSWNKADYHQALSTVWAKAARHLGEANAIFIIGYSLPTTDAFFRLLYALGTVGPSPLERIVVYNPNETGVVDSRFREILGPGAAARYEYKRLRFDQAISDINNFFPPKKR